MSTIFVDYVNKLENIQAKSPVLVVKRYFISNTIKKNYHEQSSF